MNEEFDEIKSRVVENTHSREDVLKLVEMVEAAEEELDEMVVYVLEEAELQDEV